MRIYIHMYVCLYVYIPNRLYILSIWEIKNDFARKLLEVIGNFITAHLW